MKNFLRITSILVGLAFLFPGAGAVAQDDPWHAFRWEANTDYESLSRPVGWDWESSASAINNQGHTVGYAKRREPITAPFEEQALYWTPAGEVHALGTFGYDFARAVAINNQADILVDAREWRESESRWRNETFILDTSFTPAAIPLPGPTWNVSGKDINDAGVVVGYANTPGSDTQAFRWSESSGSFDLLPGLGGAAQATAVNASGQAVGRSEDAAGVVHAVLWEADGTIVDLGTDAIARDLNDAGTVVGFTLGTKQRAFQWQRSTGMVELPTVPGFTHIRATAINNLGEIVGSDGNGSTNFTMYWDQTGTAINLRDLVGVPVSFASDINDRSQIVGALVPEPVMPVLGAAGFGYFFAGRRR